VTHPATCCPCEDAIILINCISAETVLQGTIDRLTETGRCYRMEIHVENSKVMKISRKPSPKQMIDHKKLENNKTFNYLGNMVTNGPIPVTERSKAKVCYRLLAGISGSITDGGIEVCLL
jgi:hypothetical protein